MSPTPERMRVLRSDQPGLRVAHGIVLVSTGLAFGVRGVISFLDPDYWEPTAFVDHAAISTYSVALVLAGPSLIILVHRAGAGQGATVLAWIMAVAAVLAGAANAIEDGFDQAGFGVFYLTGAVPFFFGMPVLAFVLWLGDRRAFALVPALSFVGSLAFDQGGCILIGATWAVFGAMVLLGPSGSGGSVGAEGLEPSTARL